jgi:YggT family protein
MFAISNLIITSARLAEMLLQILCFLIVLRAIISWVNPDPFQPLVQFLNRFTDSRASAFQEVHASSGPDRYLPAIAVILIYSIQKYFIVPTLMELAMRMR